MSKTKIILLSIAILLICFSLALYLAPNKIPNISWSPLSRLSIIVNPQGEINKEVDAMTTVEEATELARLDLDAHNFALQQWCEYQGHEATLDTDTGQVVCSFTATSCPKSSKLVYTTNSDGTTGIDIVNSNYYEWQNGQCVRTYPATLSLCQGFNLDYYQGNITCDDQGVCSSTEAPSCYLTADYCSSKGLDYDDGGPAGDCVETFTQQLAEAIFGKTYTRKYKQNYQDMISTCHSNPFSADCLSSTAQAVFVGDIILYDTARTYLLNNLQTIKDNCGPIFSSSTTDTPHYLECYNSIVNEFYPSNWLSEQAVNILDGLLCKIPAIPDCDLGAEIQAAIFKFQDIAIQAIIEGGIYAAKAIGSALYQCAYVIAEGAEEIATNIVSMISKMGDATTVVAQSLAYGGVALYETMYSTFQQGTQGVVLIAQTVCTAFEVGGNAVGQFVTSVIIAQGLNGLSSIGGVLLQFFGSLGRDVANAFISLGGDLQGIGNQIVSAFNQAENEIVKIFTFGGLL